MLATCQIKLFLVSLYLGNDLSQSFIICTQSTRKPKSRIVCKVAISDGVWMSRWVLNTVLILSLKVSLFY